MEADIQTTDIHLIHHSDSAVRKNVLSDWLALHEFTAESIKHTLKNARLLSQADAGQDCSLHPTVKAASNAWYLVTSALCEKFSSVDSSIESAQSEVEKDYQANALQSTPPFTLDRRPELGPLVSLHYQGTCADLICLAHEFAHAIQIQLTVHQFVNPVLRELAAFIGELALLSHLNNTGSHYSKSMYAVWQQENCVYLGTDTDNLLNNLAYEDAPYDYRWNYPIARILATRLYEKLSSEQLWQIFLGNVPLSECIRMIEPTTEENLNINYLPPMPEDAVECPAINAYRVLGMMSLLDLDYWQGQSENSIEEYYKDLLHHLGEETAFVALDKQRKPMGYATWHVNAKNVDLITITRQSVPFGDHIELLRRLKHKFPDNATIISHHERSARKDQIVW